MEDGVKEETPEKPKCAPAADKAGWIKKSSGGILSLWKERYVLLCKSQLLVYEDEDEQKCVETVELENYEKCQELRAFLKRRNRFILIRSPGYKVQDIKFQASNGEERESWMKALNEGINRGKNRIFDEVKVDESLSLEHVTRGRAKLGQGRRPPTRSHLKEVANTTSDGILRLDLDAMDSGPPNATLATSEAANTPLPKETLKPPMPPSKPLMPPMEKQSADSIPAELEVKKPPMPPIKPPKDTAASGDNLSSVEDDLDVAGEDAEQPKEVPAGDDGENAVESDKPAPEVPMPPPKILTNKVTVTWDEPTSETQGLEDANASPAGSKENLHETAQEARRPPIPPPKVLSEQLKASMASSQNGPEAGASESNCRADDLEPTVNRMDDSQMTDPFSEEPVSPGEEEQREPFSEEGQDQEASGGLLLEDQAPFPEPVANSPPVKLRCTSVGDLLEGRKKQLLLEADLRQKAACPVTEMEKKVACEQERTEKLLQKVLQGGLEQAREGNGPPINAETLLNEAAEQLLQASQVLQEIKGLEELQKEQKERRKDLVTLYRRSAP